jgi:hypothetical protein
MEQHDPTSLVAIERAIAEGEALLRRQQASLAELEVAAAPTEANRAVIQALEEALDRLRAARIAAIRAEASARVNHAKPPSKRPATQDR